MMNMQGYGKSDVPKEAFFKAEVLFREVDISFVKRGWNDGQRNVGFENYVQH